MKIWVVYMSYCGEPYNDVAYFDNLWKAEEFVRQEDRDDYCEYWIRERKLK